MTRSIPWRVRPLRTLAFTLLLVVAAACRDDNPIGPEITALSEAEARWTSVRPASNSYSMEQQVACFCGTGGTIFQVAVTGGAVVRARNLTTGADLPVAQHPMFRTIDQLFDEVRAALLTPGTLTSVEFDQATGYPSTVGLDTIKQAADDEVTYVTRRVILQP